MPPESNPRHANHLVAPVTPSPARRHGFYEKALGAAAAFAQVAAGQADLIVPVIVLAELIFALESKPLSADFDKVLGSLQASPNVTIAEWTLARTLDLRTLQAIPEMHDRLIVAETLACGATLITRDQAIVRSGLVPTIW